MRKFVFILMTSAFLSACANSGSDRGNANDSFVAPKTMDSSAQFNDSTKLPKDSSATGVMH